MSSLKRGKHGSLIELVTIVAAAQLQAIAIQAFVVKPFRIPSESMVPTLSVGQRVLADRVSYRVGSPERGDIVVFKPPLGADTGECGEARPTDQACSTPTDERSEQNFIKRVVGLPGDRLKVIGGRVFIDGRELDEPYIREAEGCPTCNLPGEITIPPDHYFMMGDNRGQSEDSRVWGPVPERDLIGQARFTYWPPKRIGTL